MYLLLDHGNVCETASAIVLLKGHRGCEILTDGGVVSSRTLPLTIAKRTERYWRGAARARKENRIYE